MFRKKKAVYLNKHANPTNTYSMEETQSIFNAKIGGTVIYRLLLKCVLFSERDGILENMNQGHRWTGGCAHVKKIWRASEIPSLCSEVRTSNLISLTGRHYSVLNVRKPAMLHQ
jgi:hypothetical protein